ncbi:hypothetical protein RJ639_013672 [Escallonia herrerae]|uniref:chalcone synthase n=1 Tax=Escallonia herrerae TaxID=1293975 RepID=A0AA88VKI3_9ASTE|nr:hypothetical protein RJ639_013672 [Escallonia herrerae]
MPGADYQLTKLLELRPSVKRLMIDGAVDCHLREVGLTLHLRKAQTILPDSDVTVDRHLREVGLTFLLFKDVAGLISKKINKSLVEAFKPLGISDWNSLFWIAHSGGPAILDQVERKLALKPEKLKPTMHVLSEYGNMSSACVLFIMDEMRKSSAKNELKTSGQGLEWGVLFGFGPGLTVETVVLHSVST